MHFGVTKDATPCPTIAANGRVGAGELARWRAFLGADSCFKARAASKRQRFPVPGELEVTASHLLSGVHGADRAFPVDGAGVRARVELLIIHERLEQVIGVADLDPHGDGILDARSRRAPMPTR